MDELNALFPAPKIVPTRQGDIAVLPLKARQIGSFAQAVSPLMDLFGGADVGAGLLREALLSYSDQVIAAVAVATDKPQSTIGDMLLDDLITLAAAVVEVNADFFGQSLLPRMTAVLTQMTAMLDGLTRSTASSNPATLMSVSIP